MTSEVLLKDSCDVDAEEGNYWTLLLTTLVFRKCWGASVWVVWRNYLVFVVTSANLTS